MFIGSSDKRFDIVIVDAYINQIYIPPPLSTEQFFDEIKSHLQPDGIIALNVNAISAQSPLLLAFERTLKTVYPHVYRVKARGDFNYLLLGSTHPLSSYAFHAIPPNSLLANVAKEWPATLHALSSADVAHDMLLTDNRAPLKC